ncbi:hypothetical protein [Pseudomonas sp. N040]|uniref:hypothetical protein n=1 Tax=Pseudomonas sp. N040 TaxID=2785325 RepID=UPI0018A3217E|nr:hypothetical protein [Pseudomonas sp. N040]MBF7730532.1 hypothetical protein [Pseudomonas sp. N040]MBW7014176.1 hypothetical protein [Pseudomonas sp. N040]
MILPGLPGQPGGYRVEDVNVRRVDDYKWWYESLCNGSIVLLNRRLAGGFKPAIGSAGLTGSVRVMHGSYLDVLRSLYAEGKMRTLDYATTLFVEYLKYPVRSLPVFFRK